MAEKYMRRRSPVDEKQDRRVKVPHADRTASSDAIYHGSVDEMSWQLPCFSSGFVKMSLIKPCNVGVIDNLSPWRRFFSSRR